MTKTMAIEYENLNMKTRMEEKDQGPTRRARADSQFVVERQYCRSVWCNVIILVIA